MVLVPDGEKMMSDQKTEKCPSCSGEMRDGMALYSCEICGKDCCSECSDTCAEKNPVCDECLESGYEDGYRQSRDG